jgi:3-oxoacyl-[acyl-carrier protein] reductase
MEQMIQDRVAIITGAGRGIGKATAKLLAREGGRVVACDRDKQPCEETVEEIRAAGGSSVSCVGDVTKEGFAEEIIERTVQEFGPDIHIIVNNAGYGGAEFIHKATDEFLHTMQAVHVAAPYRLIRAACPFMRDNAKAEMKSGKSPVCRKIVNVSSLAGTDGVQAGAAYGSAKAGVLGLTKSLAKELGPYNICVNAVAFGLIRTRLIGSSRERMHEDREVANFRLSTEAVRAFLSQTPLGREGTVQEAAGAIFFLASPLSDYVSGQVIKVSGGLW